MIQTTKTYENVGNVTGERITLRVDEAALSHIMDVVTNLYSDPIAAVVREYSTNALDSHILAGQARPIEVTLPNGFSPSFKVKDWGVGLSAADMQEVYSLYGASTKRSSNDFTGMLGLGCKSALAYSTQFTVIGVKNGVKTVCLVKRDDDGAGSLTIVSEARTDAPDSVEVSVPSSDHDDFEQAAHDLFQYWEPGTVKIDGRDPEFIWDKCQKITDSIYIQPEVRYAQGVTAVMGGVPYEASVPRRRLGNVVIKVPIGSFDFAPSRESMRDTELTRKWLKRAEQDIMDSAVAYVNRMLVDHSDVEAWRTVALMASSWGFSVEPTPDGCSLHLPQRDVVAAYTLDYRGQMGRARPASLSLLGKGRTMVVVSECGTSPTKAHADRISRHYPGSKSVVFVAGEFEAHPLVANVVAYADVMKATRSMAPRKQTATSAELTYIQLGKGRVTAAEIEASNDPIWFTQDRHRSPYESLPGRTIYVPSTRLAKFKRLFPNAKPFEEEYARWKQQQIDSVPEGQRLRVGMSPWTISKLKVLDETALDDPELVRAVKVAKQPPLRPAMLSILECEDIPDEFTEIVEKRYPLLTPHCPKHCQVYANAAYHEFHETND